MNALTLDRLSVGYAGTPIIDDFSLDVKEGERVSLLGPSGEGKTTILKAIAGLLPPTSGKIFLNGADVTKIPAERRNVAMVFQKPLLFPSMTVGENVGFGLKMQKRPSSIIREKVDAMLARVGLSGFSTRKVHTLSGGQQQRVSLARGLVTNPALLLLDEPFSSLDANLREQMRDLLCEVQDAVKVAMLLVTHDQVEALGISHRMGLLLNGTLPQFGRPDTLYHHPESLPVARFFGTDNLIEGHLSKGFFTAGDFGFPVSTGDSLSATLLVRPESIRIQENGRPATVTHARFEGALTRLAIETDGIPLVLLSRSPHKPGDRLEIGIDAAATRLFSSETGTVIPKDPS